MDKILFDFLSNNWQFLLLTFYIAEKVVKVTPWKWDDILIDAIIKPIKNLITKNYNPTKGEK